MKRSSSRAPFVLFLLSGCGLRAVELAPHAQDGNEIVVGDVARSAINALRGANMARMDATRLSFSYPSDASALPGNFAPITFEWQVKGGPAPKPGPMSKATMPAKAPMQPKMPDTDAGPAKDMMTLGPAGAAAPAPAPTPASPAAVVCELHVSSPASEVRVYTKANEVALPDARWHKLLRESAGQALKVELRVLFVDSNEIYQASPLRIEVRGPVPSGALYFWSTTAQGVLRARVDDARSVYVAPPNSSTAAGAAPTCGGCHAVARDGRRLMLGRGSPAQLAAYSLPSLQTILPATESAASAYGWAAFDPTASRIALTSAGVLRVLDADSGEALAQADLGPGIRVSHPDWSPDGRYIALTLLMGDAADDENVTGSSIARVRVALDGSLAAPEVLVAPMGKDETLLFPTYSPDGSWLAFERAMGASKEPKQASLWLVAADGGEPIELARASATGDAKGKASAADTMPTWMPGEQASAPWLLFSSTRNYGSHMLADGQEQLFVSGIEIDLAALGQDPSKPALWLPSQELSSSNHRALFAPDVTTCSASLEVCDGRDQDCDGKIDEACCTPTEERCGDGRDDDCDGKVDEGCGCLFAETCNDGVDNDCDGRIDEDCGPMPAH